MRLYLCKEAMGNLTGRQFKVSVIQSLPKQIHKKEIEGRKEEKEILWNLGMPNYAWLIKK